MSDDFRDIIRSAIEQGFPLDKCGTDERQKMWARFNDLCGMSVEDALAAQSGGGDDPDVKKRNVITLSMQNNGSGVYYLTITATYEPTADVVVSFNFDGDAKNLTLAAGQKSLTTGIQGANPNKPYAVIDSITITSTDETYTYSGKNAVKNGIFTLTINKNGVLTTEHIKYGETINLVTSYPMPSETGYNFVWRDANGYVITNGIYTMTDGNSTVNGAYEVKQYMLTYVIKEEYFDNGEIATRQYASGQTLVNYDQNIYPLLPSGQRGGYAPLSWTYNSTPINASTKMPAQNITAESKYVLSSYTLTYKVGSTIYDRQTLKYTAPVTAPSNPSKTGYEFVSWDKDIVTMPSANTIVNAVFSAIPYTIKYFVNGDLISAFTETHYYGDPITIREDYYQEGYSFSGWDTTLPATMPANDINISGTTTIIDYTLAFTVDGAPVLEQTYHFGDTVSAQVEDPSKTGYNFIGWSQETPQTMPSHDVIIEAIFEIISITVYYKLDSATTYTAITYDYGQAISAITEPSKTGYSFTGWNPSLPATAGTTDIVTYAEFSINTYTVTYVVEGETPTVVEYEYGETIQPVSDPSKTGYTFTGWSPAIPETMPDRNLVITAQFTANRHTIRWVVDDVTKYIDTYDYGDTINVRPDETKEGYSFSGWDTQLPVTMDDNDYVVSGTFSINQYTLTFLINGTLYTAITGDYGSAVVEPTPIFEGYTFSGWNAAVPSTMPASNMTFTGTKTVNQYTATYVIDSSFYTAITYNYGEIITYPEVIRSGVTVSWTRDYVTMPATDIVINGTFEEGQGTIRIFYASVPESGVSTFNDFASMSYVDYTYGSSCVEMTFVVPASPDYDRAAAELDDDDFAQWLADHMYDYYIMVPYDSAITSVVIENSMHLDVSSSYSTLPDRVLYNGLEYTVYYRQNQSQQGTDSNPMTAYILVSKSSPSVQYTAEYYIDNILYTSMTYSAGDVIIYPDVPLAGYELLWTVEYETMPLFDITINGTYVEVGETVVVYYGPVLHTGITEYNAYSALTRLECQMSVDKFMPMTIPAFPGYEEIESTYTEEEFQAWIVAHTYDYYLLIPTDPTLYFVYKNQANDPVEFLPVDNTTVTIDGKSYKKVYTYITSQDGTDQTFNYKITVSKIV